MSDGGNRDGLLLARWRSGETAAASELVRRHQRPVFGFLLSLTGERSLAEDLLQETFLRVLERQASYEEMGQFRAMLFRIARNLCADHFRRNSRRRPAAEGMLESLPSGEDLEQTAAVDRRSAKLREAMTELSAEQREVVLLHYYSGLTFREIAEVQGCSLGTCLGRMHYALKHLRKLLPQEEWAHEL